MMSDPTTKPLRDDLAALEAQMGAALAAHEAELGALRRELAGRHARARRGPRRGRFARLLTGLAVALLVALVPLSIMAAGPFGDLDPAQAGPDGHNPNIQLIADAGITKGCNPPDYTAYCPKDVVTREQMATFLARTAGLGSNPPVVNAKTALLAANAYNAGTVGNYSAADLVRTNRGSVTSTLNLTTTAQSYGSAVQMDVPKAGFVIITGAVNFKYVSGTCPCNVISTVRHVETGNQSNDTGPSVSSAVPYSTAAHSWVFPVTPGMNSFDFRVNVQNLATPPVVEARNGEMTVLFVPFGHSGGAALSTDPGQPAAPATKP